MEVPYLFFLSYSVRVIYCSALSTHHAYLTSVLSFSSVYTLHLECSVSVLPVASNPFFSRMICNLSDLQLFHLQNDGA